MKWFVDEKISCRDEALCVLHIKLSATFFTGDILQETNSGVSKNLGMKKGE